MAHTAPAAMVVAPADDMRSPLRRIATQFADSRVAVAALATLLVVAVIAVTAPLIAPQNPYDLRAIDIEDGRLPPGSPKLSKQADTGMTIRIGDPPVGEGVGYDVKARGRAADAPVDALDLRLAEVLNDGAGRRYAMALEAVPAAPWIRCAAFNCGGCRAAPSCRRVRRTSFATCGSSRARTCAN